MNVYMKTIQLYKKQTKWKKVLNGKSKVSYGHSINKNSNSGQFSLDTPLLRTIYSKRRCSISLIPRASNKLNK